MYRGDIAGTRATLQVTGADDTLQGVIDAGGYRYLQQLQLQLLLQLQATGATANGTLQDPQAGRTGEASLVLSGDVIEAVIALPAARSAREIRLSFTRHGTTVARAPASGDAGRNLRLVGTWTRKDTLRSGDATLVTRLVMVVNADGTFAQRTGETVGGGTGWGVSSRGSEGASGFWRTEGDFVHVGNGQTWQPYARYYIERGTLMLTFADNSREL